MTTQHARASFDVFCEPDNRTASARKSDTFLHTRLRRAGAIPDQNRVLDHGKHENVHHAGAGSSDILQERLSQMFGENVQLKKRRSVDVVSALDHKFIPDDGIIGAYNLPRKQVPDRQSSLLTSEQASLQNFPSWRLPPPSAAGKFIIDRGRAESPVKRSIAKDPVTSDALRLSPSRTFIRPSPPLLLLQSGNVHSKRIALSLDLNAPIFMGGGTIEGKVNIDIDRGHHDHMKRKDLLISKLSVDIVGCELMGDGRK